MSADYIRALICREMGWTWKEYDEQPVHFIAIVAGLLRAENEQAQKRSAG